MPQITKVGRNDPCSCGSGKKYKKCCEKKSASTRGTRLMMALVGLVLVGGLLAALNNFSTDTTHTAKTTGVWDPVHGHYH